MTKQDIIHKQEVDRSWETKNVLMTLALVLLVVVVFF